MGFFTEQDFKLAGLTPAPKLEPPSQGGSFFTEEDFRQAAMDDEGLKTSATIQAANIYASEKIPKFPYVKNERFKTPDTGQTYLANPYNPFLVTGEALQNTLFDTLKAVDMGFKTPLTLLAAGINQLDKPRMEKAGMPGGKSFADTLYDFYLTGNNQLTDTLARTMTAYPGEEKNIITSMPDNLKAAIASAPESTLEAYFALQGAKGLTNALYGVAPETVPTLGKLAQSATAAEVRLASKINKIPEKISTGASKLYRKLYTKYGPARARALVRVADMVIGKTGKGFVLKTPAEIVDELANTNVETAKNILANQYGIYGKDQIPILKELLGKSAAAPVSPGGVPDSSAGTGSLPGSLKASATGSATTVETPTTGNIPTLVATEYTGIRNAQKIMQPNYVPGKPSLLTAPPIPIHDSLKATATEITTQAPAPKKEFFTAKDFKEAATDRPISTPGGSGTGSLKASATESDTMVMPLPEDEPGGLKPGDTQKTAQAGSVAPKEEGEFPQGRRPVYPLFKTKTAMYFDPAYEDLFDNIGIPYNKTKDKSRIIVRNDSGFVPDEDTPYDDNKKNYYIKNIERVINRKPEEKFETDIGEIDDEARQALIKFLHAENSNFNSRVSITDDAANHIDKKHLSDNKKLIPDILRNYDMLLHTKIKNADGFNFIKIKNGFNLVLETKYEKNKLTVKNFYRIDGDKIEEYIIKKHSADVLINKKSADSTGRDPQSFRPKALPGTTGTTVESADYTGLGVRAPHHTPAGTYPGMTGAKVSPDINIIPQNEGIGNRERSIENKGEIPNPYTPYPKSTEVGSVSKATAADFITNTAKIQPRTSDYSEKTVSAIVNNLDPTMFDPLEVVEDSNGNKLIVSGHSRLEGMKRRIAAGTSPADTLIPYRIVRRVSDVNSLSPEELSTIRLRAEQANYQGDPFTPLEEAENFAKYPTIEEARKSTNYQKNKAYIERRKALSYLSDNLKTEVKKLYPNQNQAARTDVPISIFETIGKAVKLRGIDAGTQEDIYNNFVLRKIEAGKKPEISNEAIDEFLKFKNLFKADNQQLDLFGSGDLEDVKAQAADKITELIEKRKEAATYRNAIKKTVGLVKKKGAPISTAELEDELRAIEREIQQREYEIKNLYQPQKALPDKITTGEKQIVPDVRGNNVTLKPDTYEVEELADGKVRLKDGIEATFYRADLKGVKGKAEEAATAPAGEGEKIKLPERIIYDPLITAEAQVINNEIHVGDKFFKLSEKAKKEVLKHEEGHIFADSFMKGYDYWKVSDSGIFGKEAIDTKGNPYYDGIMGRPRADEAVAEAYAQYHENPKWLKEQYPEAYRFIEAIIQGKNVDEAIIIAKKTTHIPAEKIYERVNYTKDSTDIPATPIKLKKIKINQAREIVSKLPDKIFILKDSEGEFPVKFEPDEIRVAQIGYEQAKKELLEHLLTKKDPITNKRKYDNERIQMTQLIEKTLNEPDIIRKRADGLRYVIKKYINKDSKDVKDIFHLVIGVEKNGKINVKSIYPKNSLLLDESNETFKRKGQPTVKPADSRIGEGLTAPEPASPIYDNIIPQNKGEMQAEPGSLKASTTDSNTVSETNIQPPIYKSVTPFMLEKVGAGHIYSSGAKAIFDEYNKRITAEQESSKTTIPYKEYSDGKIFAKDADVPDSLKGTMKMGAYFEGGIVKKTFDAVREAFNYIKNFKASVEKKASSISMSKARTTPDTDALVKYISEELGEKIKDINGNSINDKLNDSNYWLCKACGQTFSSLEDFLNKVILHGSTPAEARSILMAAMENVQADLMEAYPQIQGLFKEEYIEPGQKLRTATIQALKNIFSKSISNESAGRIYDILTANEKTGFKMLKPDDVIKYKGNMTGKEWYALWQMRRGNPDKPLFDKEMAARPLGLDAAEIRDLLNRGIIAEVKPEKTIITSKGTVIHYKATYRVTPKGIIIMKAIWDMPAENYLVMSESTLKWYASNIKGVTNEEIKKALDIKTLLRKQAIRQVELGAFPKEELIRNWESYFPREIIFKGSKERLGKRLNNPKTPKAEKELIKALLRPDKFEEIAEKKLAEFRSALDETPAVDVGRKVPVEWMRMAGLNVPTGSFQRSDGLINPSTNYKTISAEDWQKLKIKFETINMMHEAAGRLAKMKVIFPKSPVPRSHTITRVRLPEWFDEVFGLNDDVGDVILRNIENSARLIRRFEAFNKLAENEFYVMPEEKIYEAAKKTGGKFDADGKLLRRTQTVGGEVYVKLPERPNKSKGFNAPNAAAWDKKPVINFNGENYVNARMFSNEGLKTSYTEDEEDIELVDGNLYIKMSTLPEHLQAEAMQKAEKFRTAEIYRKLDAAAEREHNKNLAEKNKRKIKSGRMGPSNTPLKNKQENLPTLPEGFSSLRPEGQDTIPVVIELKDGTYVHESLLPDDAFKSDADAEQTDSGRAVAYINGQRFINKDADPGLKHDWGPLAEKWILKDIRDYVMKLEELPNLPDVWRMMGKIGKYGRNWVTVFNLPTYHFRNEATSFKMGIEGGVVRIPILGTGYKTTRDRLARGEYKKEWIDAGLINKEQLSGLSHYRYLDNKGNKFFNTLEALYLGLGEMANLSDAAWRIVIWESIKEQGYKNNPEIPKKDIDEYALRIANNLVPSFRDNAKIIELLNGVLPFTSWGIKAQKHNLQMIRGFTGGGTGGNKWRKAQGLPEINMPGVGGAEGKKGFARWMLLGAAIPFLTAAIAATVAGRNKVLEIYKNKPAFERFSLIEAPGRIYNRMAEFVSEDAKIPEEVFAYSDLMMSGLSGDAYYAVDGEWKKLNIANKLSANPTDLAKLGIEDFNPAGFFIMYDALKSGHKTKGETLAEALNETLKFIPGWKAISKTYKELRGNGLSANEAIQIATGIHIGQPLTGPETYKGTNRSTGDGVLPTGSRLHRGTVVRRNRPAVRRTRRDVFGGGGKVWKAKF